MREILYKAKRLDNGEWYEGASLVLFYGTPENKEKGIYGTAYFVRRGSSAYSGLADESGTKYHAVELVPVDPLTIGQFTGLTDKNGKKIFEGDVVKTESWGICIVGFGEHQTCEPDYYSSSAYGWFLKSQKDETFTILDKCEVIGNIHDNT